MSILESPAPPQDSTVARRVEGRVIRGTREKQQPVPNQWVVLHRVGHDHAGPLDSVRTNAAGGFAMRYHTSGDTAALYFVATSYGGVAYFSSPLRGPVVRGDDASLTVFDTTSGAVPIAIGGRHLVIGSPRANGRRPVGEVYDLENDSTVTVVARDSTTPVWSTHIPTAAVAFQLNTGGDITAGAVSHSNSTVGLYVPLSPGIRQFAFTYELPSSAFPLAIPMERPTGVLEVLVEEPTARVQGMTLREVAPQSVEGRTFRRFLGRELPGNAVISVDVPHVAGATRERVYVGVAVSVLAAMAVALMFAARRAKPRLGSFTPRAEPRSQVLLRAIAELDAQFERVPANDGARADYEARRATLKRDLADALAAERGRA